MKFEIKQIKKLNDRHIFNEDVLGNFVFEDGFYCDYDSADVKLKLIQISFALSPLIKSLDFS